ncbi:MAG: hypothetical protein JXN64_11940 [Spirochaetes bacterium]|nr:hypothetical protein [Spirochaetota bacterium]
MRNRLCSIIVIAFISLVTACTTDYNTLIKDSESEFYKNNYMSAAKKLLPYINKEDKNQLLFMMECGLMLHAAGEYEKSNTILIDAGKLADKIATSISKEAAALLLNETQTNYKGEDFERVLIHMYTGINFLMLNNPDNARVSFKKVNDMLREINVTGGKTYKQNIMAKYLTAIAFELTADMNKDENDTEFAYIEYKQIHELAPKLELVYDDLQRLAYKLGDKEEYNKWVSKFGKRYNVPKNSGELIIFYHAGRGAVKASRGNLLKDSKMKTGITVSLGSMPLKTGVTVGAALIALNVAEHPIPVFKKRSNKIRQLEIDINGKKTAGTVLLEDIENTAVKNMEEQYSGMYMKVAAGIAVKAAASVATGLAARQVAKSSGKQVGQFAGIIGAIAGATTGAALASQIKPDLRCWHTLPANLQIGRMFLMPGVYDITVKYINNNGTVSETRTSKIEIKNGVKTFLNYRTIY